MVRCRRNVSPTVRSDDDVSAGALPKDLLPKEDVEDRSTVEGALGPTVEGDLATTVERIVSSTVEGNVSFTVEGEVTATVEERR
jgi:hypothetical protein